MKCQCCLVVLCLTGSVSASAPEFGGKVVDFDGLKSVAPAEWQVEESAGAMRFMQFKLPRVKDDTADAEIVIGSRDMDRVDEADVMRLVLHHDGTGADAVAEEANALHERAIGDASGHKRDRLAGCRHDDGRLVRMLGGVLRGIHAAKPTPDPPIPARARHFPC